MINALALKLRLERFPCFGDCPHILRPTFTLLGAECASVQASLKEHESFSAAEDSHLVAQCLSGSRATRGVEIEVARIALVLGVSAVAQASDSREQGCLPGLKRFSRTELPFRIERSSP